MGYQLGDEFEIPAGPWIGVMDSTDPKQARRKQLFDAINGYIPDPRNGSAFLARPGFVGLSNQFGITDVRRGQGMITFKGLDGSTNRYTFGGGKMYLWDGDILFTDITPGGDVEIDTENPVFCTVFNDEILITDETNKPWIFTPRTSASEVIEYNDANEEWTTKGGFVIYGGYAVVIIRAVGLATLQTEAEDAILAEDGSELLTELTSGLLNTITWSNALDARTGYDQGNFDHVWQLTQTSSEVLGGLFAEEGALVFWRNVGIGYITGQINDDWRGSATRDRVSNTIGTNTPAAIVAYNGWLYFLDMDGRPYRCRASASDPEPLYFPARRAVEANEGTTANRANVLAYARGTYDPRRKLILWTIWDRTTVYAFDAESGRYAGQWEVLGGMHITAMGEMLDDQSRPMVCMIGTRGTSFDADDEGVFWREKMPEDSSQWLDQADSSVASHTAFERAVETHWLVEGGVRKFKAIRVVAQFVGDDESHTVRLQYVVPKTGLSSALSASTSVVEGEMSDKDAISTARWSLGRNAQGGSMRLRVSATNSDNRQWGIHDLTMMATVTATRSKAA